MLKLKPLRLEEALELFDEATYLGRYRDIAEAVAKGELESGRAHFERWGHLEGRSGSEVAFNYEPGRFPWPESHVRVLWEQSTLAVASTASCAARAKLATFTGDDDLAAESFSDYAQLASISLTDKPGEFITGMNTAFVCNRLSFASELIRRRFPDSRCEFLVAFKDGGPSANSLIRCEFRSRYKAIFLLNRAILSSDQTEYFVNRWSSSLELFARYVKSTEFVPGIVDISVGDQAVFDGLAYCSNRENSFLVPDPYFLSESGYRALRENYDHLYTPWRERIDVVYWRGSTTGIKTGGWKTLQRAQLCLIVRGHESAEEFDIKFSNVTQFVDIAAVKTEIQQCDLLDGHVREDEFIRYKYQIDVDGNTNSWPGFFQKLLTGSPVLKVASPLGFRQWYYDRLEPWVHFVPVRVDLSDFFEKVAWLRANEEDAQRIGENGRKFAESLTFEGELDRAMPIIAAAISHVAQRNGAPK